MTMEYHFKENWQVTVNIEVTHEGASYKFNFDFIVNTDETWKDIIRTTNSIIKERFGHSGYKLLQISLVNIN